jgi:L-alanine-DL-glutamate epimerase-like enolase superfamily enzyme
MVGQRPDATKRRLLAEAEANPNAVSIVVAALEMLEENPVLRVASETRVPLLQGLSATTPGAVSAEIETILAQGFGTIKVKVGFDVEQDLALVRAVQRATAGRARLRLDANRGFDRDQGCRFASSLDPADIMLFEQPCDADDWVANAAVAAVSRVPVMLDESIYGLADIARAAAIPGVGFLKLKLKKAGGLDRLKAALERIRALGLEPVLGDGVSTEINCWMEACVARLTIDNAGEMNGFLRPKGRLFKNPLEFERGAIVLPAGYAPELDPEIVAAHCVAEERFAATSVAVGG